MQTSLPFVAGVNKVLLSDSRRSLSDSTNGHADESGGLESTDSAARKTLQEYFSDTQSGFIPVHYTQSMTTLVDVSKLTVRPNLAQAS